MNIRILIMIIIITIMYIYGDVSDFEHFKHDQDNKSKHEKNNKTIRRAYPKLDPRPHPLDYRYISNIDTTLPIFPILTTASLSHSDEKLDMLNLFLTFHELFEQHNIWYIIIFKTLTDSILTGNIVDTKTSHVLINFSDIDAIKLLVPVFESLGYKVVFLINQIQIISNKNNSINMYPINKKNNTVVRCVVGFGNCTHPDNVYDPMSKFFNFSSNFIKSRKQYLLQPLLVWGPSNPNELLNYWKN